MPCGIFKDQPDPPLKPRDEYPAFLWKLLDKQPTLKELMEKYLQNGEVALTEQEVGLRNRIEVKN